MRSTLRLAFVFAVVAALAACSQVTPKSPGLTAQGVAGSTRTLTAAGTSQFVFTTPSGVQGVQNPELPPAMTEKNAAAGAPNGRIVNRIPQKTQVPFTAPTGTAAGIVPGPSGQLSFQGLNLFDQRFANGGNQFTVEPPDQGLCVGGNYVMEAVNDVVRVYNKTDGSSANGVASLNQFLGYAPAIVRDPTNSANDVYGPFVTDPSCHFDAATQRWFLTVLTLDTIPTGAHRGSFTGTNTLDIAVSNSADPTGTWSIYHLDVTADGSNVSGSPYNLGDYPHFAVDANGVYITTDSFPFFGAGYNGAWVYAIGKSKLEGANGTLDVPVFASAMVDSGGIPGYSVAPAIPVGSQTPTTNGTEYFTSATTVYQGSGHELNVWALDGTASLNSDTPSLTLTSVRVPVGAYGDPPYFVPQQNGSVPLADAFNANLFGYGKPPHHQQEGKVAANDSGMKQTVFVNGHLWAALATVTQGAPAGGHSHGANQAGVAWYELSPSMSGGSLSASLDNSGVIAPVGADLLFPAITMNASGQGAIAVTLVGNHHYPSAAYVPIQADGSTGDIVVAHAGAGAQDGFTEYFLGGPDPRWGDYGAAAVDASGNLWIASEDIHQTCTYGTYLSDLTCGGTRAPLGNWSTQITEVQP